MTAEIHRLPPRKPTLRLVHPQRDWFGNELAATAQAIQQAAEHFVAASFTHTPETRIAAGSDALEEALFHALTMKGCSNHDLPLRRMLAVRFEERSRTNG